MAPRQHAGRQAASMRCPFLVEGTAHCCGLAPFRKLVPESAAAARDQCCSSDAWRSCAWVRQQGVPTDADAPDGHCPFLDEMIACSCAAAPSSKLIPRTLLAVHRCLGDAHRYCEFFLAQAGQQSPADRAGGLPRPGAQPAGAAAIPIASGAALAPNHMWLDVGPDGTCHVGVDAFLVRVVGAVDEVIFLSPFGPASPSLALTVAGIPLPLVFPHPLRITRVNSALRRHPGDLVADPYGRGWLYEGRPVRRPGRIAAEAPRAGLRHGPDAEVWMASELRRLSRHVRAILSRRGTALGSIAADGGEVRLPLAGHLERDELLEIFSLFFGGAAG